jgi:hypothetical protein
LQIKNAKIKANLIFNNLAAKIQNFNFKKLFAFGVVNELTAWSAIFKLL